MSTSFSPRTDPAVLPSLPPSPSLLDEVFSHPRPWSVRLEDAVLQPQGLRRSSPGSPSSRTKGKGKQTPEEEEEEDDASHGVTTSTHESYPPMTDEAAETRRVEETLRRWELAERQRRKSARESAQQHTSTPSLLASVTRTASLVLAGRSSASSSAAGTGGPHHPFKSHEAVDVAREGYGLPLDDIDRAVRTPSPSVFSRDASLDAPGTGPSVRARSSDNPFEHPSERSSSSSPPTPTPASPMTPTPPLLPSKQTLLSPFADAHAQGVYATDSETHARKRSPLVPPPRPLGLPSLPEDMPHAVPLQATPPPVLRSSSPPREDPEERQEVRWWHEWLCGCGEGPDRGGDNQAGRTNPFE